MLWQSFNILYIACHITVFTHEQRINSRKFLEDNAWSHVHPNTPYVTLMSEPTHSQAKMTNCQEIYFGGSCRQFQFALSGEHTFGPVSARTITFFWFSFHITWLQNDTFGDPQGSLPPSDQADLSCLDVTISSNHHIIDLSCSIGTSPCITKDN